MGHVALGEKAEPSLRIVLAQIHTQLCAMLHQVACYPFVVHFLDRAVPDLRGAVEVVGDPYGRPDPLVCDGVTVMGACLER